MKRVYFRNTLLAVAAGFFFLINGCAYFSKTASVQTAIAPDGSPTRAGRVAVPVFIHEKYKSGAGEKQWGDPAITDRFVTGLLRRGYLVIDRAVVNKVLKDNGFSSSDVYREDNVARIGALLGADVVVLGKMTLVEQGDGQIQSRVVTVRGIRAADGQVLFSLSAVDTTMYRVLSGEDLIDQALAAMFGWGKGDGKTGKGAPPSTASVQTGARVQATVQSSMGASSAPPDTGAESGEESLYEDSPPSEVPAPNGEEVVSADDTSEPVSESEN